MMDDDQMMTEVEPQSLHPMMTPTEATPAEADPATAALSAGQPSEYSPEDATPDEEQEDPYAGRELPGEPVAPPELPPGENDVGEGDEGQAGGVASELPSLPESAPVSPVGDEARQRYWRGVLTGAAATVPDAVRRRAGVTDAALSDEQGEYRLLSTINRSWAADNLGHSREQVRTDWPRLRAELARRFKVGDDEQELFAALSVEAQDAPHRERVKALYETHCRAALLGREAPAEKEDALPYADELADEARRRGETLRERYLPLAQELAEGLEVFAGLEEDVFPAPRVLSAAPEFVRAVDSLADMDERSRQLVYAIAQGEFRAKHPQENKESLYRTMLRATRRGATGLGLGVGQALAQASIATMHSVGSVLGEVRGRRLRDESMSLDRRARVADEVRSLLYEEVNPLQLADDAGLVSRLMVDAAGATPAALVACCGGAGFAALGLSGMGEAVVAARRRAPEGRQWLQYLAGVVGGGIQASIYAGMSRVGGQMLTNAVGNVARASGKGAGGYSLASLGVLGAMGAEEAKLLFAGKAAEGAGLATQELAARLEKTASNIDWQEYGDNAQDIEMNLREAAMNLPFILIASGRVALRHFRSRDAVLGDGYALQRWGIDEATREAIMSERDINRQGDLLREALRSSRRWSAPGFLPEAVRALRLLNTDYYQGFKDPQVVVDFLRLPSQGNLVPRPPLVEYSAENPEHAKLLLERHGNAENVNRSRQLMALQLWDEWWQKAHLVPEGAGESLPTSQRRRHYGVELMQPYRTLPRRVLPGGFYAPHAEAERMAMLRDRVAEVHDLSYQLLLTSFPVDTLSHSTRGLDQLRQASDTARTSLLEAVGRSVIRQATGTPEAEAMAELDKAITDYFARRRYTHFPPGWMKQVPGIYTHKLGEYAHATFSQELAEAPEELRNAFRIALGFKFCATDLYRLLPISPDFRTALARGLSPAEAYVHLLSRELGVDMSKVRGVPEMLAPFNSGATDMHAFRRRNEEAFSHYSRLTGYELESARGSEDGSTHWRVRRPNGSYTQWHRQQSDAINDLVAQSALTFMPFSYDYSSPLRNLSEGKNLDLNTEGKVEGMPFTGYDHLCRVALRDAARFWVESAPFALPGYDLRALRRYVYIGGKNPQQGVLMRKGEQNRTPVVEVDSYTLSSPLRLVQSRFHAYWWRQLNSGMLTDEQAGNELVKLRVISPEQWQSVQDIAKPLAMPRNKDTPLKLTPPPDVAGMRRELSSHLADFSTCYFLAHLDDMPLPVSTREWFRLAPLCPDAPAELPERARRLSMKTGQEFFTSLHNRTEARELREMAPAVAELRQKERDGLLTGCSLVEGLRNAAGLNPTLHCEQAWCANYSGTDAMMSVPQPFWLLMEKPVEGWAKLDEASREALRAHAGGIARTELSPEAMEAEARAESPDYLLYGLQNLQDVLMEYPSLHRYGLLPREGQALVHHLEFQEPTVSLEPFAEPEYARAPLYTGGRMQEGFQLSEAAELPESLQGDSRILPALHLLGALRTYPGSRPFARREGIQWRGGLYGGRKGLHPHGLEPEDWAPEPPLTGLLRMFSRIDELKALQSEEQPLMHLDMELPVLGEELDFSPLANVTLYRGRDNPSKLCRLMPGEAESPTLAARTPYVVQTIAGVSYDHHIALRQPEDMFRAYTPLERFQPYKGNLHAEDGRERFSRQTVDYTLSCLPGGSDSSLQVAVPGLRELLMRFAEDSGFSYSLRDTSPYELTGGQVLALRVARELLLAVCGPKPAAAMARLAEVSRRVMDNDEERHSLTRTLFSAAEQVYSKGDSLYRRVFALDERRKRQERRRARNRAGRLHLLTIPAEERRLLDEWKKRHGGNGGWDDFYDD